MLRARLTLGLGLSAAAVVLVMAAGNLAFGQAKPRPAGDIWRSLTDNRVELAKSGAIPLGLLDKEKRPAIAPVAIPLLKKRLALFEELARAQGNTNGPGETRFDQLYIMSLLVSLGDDEAAHSVAAAAKRNTPDGFYAKVCQNLSAWFDSAGNAMDQSKLVEPIRALAKSAPLDEPLTQAMLAMTGAAASKELGATIEEIIAKDLKSASAVLHKNIPRVDKPVVIAGTTTKHETFSTARWKGKVILVHFWAIDDGQQSRFAHSDLRDAWKTYHDKGLEIAGVFSAEANDSTTGYLAEKAFPWPELMDVPHPTRHPLMSQCDVEFNAAFLIDRNGILRSRNGLKDLPEMLPALLDEKVDAGSTRPAAGPAGK